MKEGFSLTHTETTARSLHLLTKMKIFTTRESSSSSSSSSSSLSAQREKKILIVQRSFLITCSSLSLLVCNACTCAVHNGTKCVMNPRGDCRTSAGQANKLKYGASCMPSHMPKYSTVAPKLDGRLIARTAYSEEKKCWWARMVMHVDSCATVRVNSFLAPFNLPLNTLHNYSSPNSPFSVNLNWLFRQSRFQWVTPGDKTERSLRSLRQFAHLSSTRRRWRASEKAG